MPDAIRVRHKMPVLRAIQWQDDMTDVPGVRYEDGHPPYVVTEHRVKVVLKSGMWLVFRENGQHLKPCSDDEFRVLYEGA